MNTKLRNNIYILTIFFLAVTVVFIVTSRFNKYELEIGSVSPTLFKASREIVDTVTTQNNIDEAEANVSTVYTVDDTITEQVYNSIDDFFANIKAMRDYYELVKLNIANGLNLNQNGEDIPKNIEELNNKILEEINLYINNNKIPLLTNEEQIFLITASDEEIDSIKNKVVQAIDTVLEQGVTSENIESQQKFIEDFLAEELTDTSLEISKKAINFYLKPNLIPDEEATKLKIEAAKDEVEPTIILEGQTIVDEGEIITESDYQLLLDLGYIRETSTTYNIKSVVSISLYVTILIIVFLSYAITCKSKEINVDKNIKLLVTIVTLTILLIPLTKYLNGMFSPIYIMMYLTTTFISTSVAIVLLVIMSLLYSYALSYSTIMLVTNLVIGFAVIISAKEISKNAKMVKTTGTLIAFAILYYITMNMLTLDYTSSGYFINYIDFRYVVLIAINIILIVVISVGSIPIWETIFDILTPMRLIDLTRPSNPVLRKLILEAPGTYHHSLIVTNLAEQAAIDIGANPHKTRVGGYYHDIGKMYMPTAYSENQNGVNLHDDLTPEQSVEVIKNHVTKGIEIARENKLPKLVEDMIIEHQGTTLIQYFYVKALENAENKEDVNIEDFRYTGRIPQSRESAILMLADTVEAAVRSHMSKNNDLDKVPSIVDSLINKKIEDKQLIDSQLTYGDVENIKQSFNNVFIGMYHKRVAYPKLDKK